MLCMQMRGEKTYIKENQAYKHIKKYENMVYRVKVVINLYTDFKINQEGFE